MSSTSFSEGTVVWVQLLPDGGSHQSSYVNPTQYKTKSGPPSVRQRKCCAGRPMIAKHWMLHCSWIALWFSKASDQKTYSILIFKEVGSEGDGDPDPSPFPPLDPRKFTWLNALKYTYSKICVEQSFSKLPKMGFQDQLSLFSGQIFAECSKGSILQYFWPSLSYRLSLRSLFCLFLSGRLTTGAWSSVLISPIEPQNQKLTVSLLTVSLLSNDIVSF